MSLDSAAKRFVLRGQALGKALDPFGGSIQIKRMAG